MQLVSRSVLALLAVIFLLNPTTLFAAAVSAGVPIELIWFSKESFFAGDQITIFTPLYNSSPYRFSGVVELHDGETTIGTQEFALLPGGTFEVFAFPWKATSGEHAFSVLIANGKFFSNDQSSVDLPISEGTLGTLKRLVETKQEPPLPTGVTPESLHAVAVLEERLNAYLPAPLAAKALPILGGMELFRVNQATRANGMEKEIVAGLVSGGVVATATSSGWSVFTEGVAEGDIIHTPWEYVKLFFVLCYGFLTANIYAFYILCSYILYRIIRFALSFFTS